MRRVILDVGTREIVVVFEMRKKRCANDGNCLVGREVVALLKAVRDMEYYVREQLPPCLAFVDFKLWRVLPHSEQERDMQRVVRYPRSNHLCRLRVGGHIGRTIKFTHEKWSP